MVGEKDGWEREERRSSGDGGQTRCGRLQGEREGGTTRATPAVTKKTRRETARDRRKTRGGEHSCRRDEEGCSTHALVGWSSRRALGSNEWLGGSSRRALCRLGR